MKQDGRRVALLKSRRLAIELDQAYDGGSVHVVKQIKSLCANGYEVDAFARSETGRNQPPVEISSKLRVWHVAFTPCDSKDFFVRDLIEGRSFVQNVLASSGFAAAHFDAIQIHHWTSGVNIHEALPETIPIAFTPHLLPTEKALANGVPLPSSVVDVERGLLARADITVAVSRAEEQSCRRLGGHRVKRIANGVSDAFFRLPVSRKPTSGEAVRLGSIGRMCAQKGTDVLLDAMELLVARGVNAYLDIVGPSYGEDEFECNIRQRLLDPMLSGRVRLLGAVSHELLPSIVAEWHVYLQPSRYESQGTALLEAMAASRCVVATSLSAITEFLNDRIGFLVPAPPDGEAVAEAVFDALQSSTWETQVRGARNAAMPFRWKRSTSELSECLSALIERADWRDRNKTAKLSHDFQEQGRKIALKIAKGVPIAGIFLLGSAARGEVRPGSDIDLLMLQDGGQRSDQDWRFTQFAPVDIRWETTEYVHRLCAMSNDELADAVAQRPLVDYLCGARELTCIGQDLADVIALLRQRRSSSEVKFLVANRMLAQASTIFDKAVQLTHQGLIADAQIKINAGAQLILQASLVQNGWMIQGAKRRLEAAASYAPFSVSVRHAASFLTAAVGIDGVTYEHARRLITARTQMRVEHVKCLEKLGVDSTEIAIARRHAQGVTDYYSPAISDGYLKGCINHIKSLSGVPLMTAHYTRLLNLDPNAPAQSFLSCADISTEVQNLWLTVVDPHELEALSEFAAIGSRFARELIPSVTN